MMSREQFEAELGKLEGYASINQRYHQKMVEYWGILDRWVKIFLAIFAVSAFALTLLGFLNSRASIAAAFLSFLSLAAAMSLTYFAFDARERSHAESFARWTYLHQDITTTAMRLKMAPEKEVAWLSQRLPELVAKIGEIEKQELPPNRKVLLKAQGDENESLWGAGIRTHEQVLAEQAKRKADSEATKVSGQMVAASGSDRV